MGKYELTFETFDGEIIQEVVYANTLKIAKEELKDIYRIKKFI